MPLDGYNNTTMNLATIFLRQNQWERMEAHVRAMFPKEACGVLAGKESGVHWVQPITNVEEDRRRFRMDPQEQLDALLRIEEEGLHLIGIYHSHPDGPAELSMSDISEAAYLEAAHLVWFPAAEKWACKAFIIEHKTTREIPIQIVAKGTLSG
ncbi:MAG: M67 family metallopeptidase [Anaerolineales bacterium]|jgi:proteasome lid subunit RPN8/RPN11